MNCYEAMKRMIEIDEKMQEISSKLKSTSDTATRTRLEVQIDALESEFLDLKHSLERTPLTIINYR